MNIEKLKKYQIFYKSSRNMGAARILRDYLKLVKNYPIPLSIPHGVDMNHTTVAMDVNSVEPIHWSHNQSVHERALMVKPSVRMPHPWLMLKANRPIMTGSGVLVIGPPPGKSNDNNLLSRLKDLKISSCHILLKKRGKVDSSRDFWIENGYEVVSAGIPDDFFYDRLFDILEKFEYVIGCTLSSALYFSASIERKCRLIEGYVYSFYDTSNYLEMINFTSPVARKFTLLLRSEKDTDIADFASNVLGSAFIGDVQLLKKELEFSIDSIKTPVHFGIGSGESITRKLILRISLYFGKTSLIQNGLWGSLRRRIKNNSVSLIQINEIDVWIQGVNKENFRVKEVPYLKNITEPGCATD